MSKAARTYVAVFGGYRCDEATAAAAEEVGRLLAEAGCIVVTGGREGVAAAASRGAQHAGGLTLGILPSRDRSEANDWVTVAVPTGLGETRNALVVMDADAVIAFPGLDGTLSEMAFALLGGAPVVSLGGWELARDGEAESRIVPADSPASAVAAALALSRSS
jgi:hypothetical protein